MEELPNFSMKYYEKLEERGIHDETAKDAIYNRFLKNNVIIKYSKKWQDETLDYWIDIILNVPGGYWIFQDLVQYPHVEFEHYNHKLKMSYEKGNVTQHRANIELRKENREAYNYFHYIRESNKKKGVIEVVVEGDVTINSKDL